MILDSQGGLRPPCKEGPCKEGPWHCVAQVLAMARITLQGGGVLKGTLERPEEAEVGQIIKIMPMLRLQPARFSSPKELQAPSLER